VVSAFIEWWPAPAFAWSFCLRVTLRLSRNASALAYSFGGPRLPPKSVARDGCQARRRDAAAVAAVRFAAVLTRRDPRLEIGRDALRRPGEHAVGGRVRRLRVDVEQPLGRDQLWISQSQRHQIGDDPLAVGRTEPFGRDFADLGRVQAHPDLDRFRPRGPEAYELFEIT
jgi:hypothetical protein